MPMVRSEVREKKAAMATAQNLRNFIMIDSCQVTFSSVDRKRMKITCLP
jgi:hypothetical protein